MLTIDSHQRLRFALESEIVARITDTQVARDTLNACMVHVLAALEQQLNARSELDRQFHNFHRNPDAPVPSWAFREPGSRPQLEPLR